MVGLTTTLWWLWSAMVVQKTYGRLWSARPKKRGLTYRFFSHENSFSEVWQSLGRKPFFGGFWSALFFSLWSAQNRFACLWLSQAEILGFKTHKKKTFFGSRLVWIVASFRWCVGKESNTLKILFSTKSRSYLSYFEPKSSRGCNFFCDVLCKNLTSRKCSLEQYQYTFTTDLSRNHVEGLICELWKSGDQNIRKKIEKNWPLDFQSSQNHTSANFMVKSYAKVHKHWSTLHWHEVRFSHNTSHKKLQPRDDLGSNTNFNVT